ncbi:MAG: DEAD/DEAH box helicase family protein [Muribaculaceae bacterium]|nr:DEAD/DEAH box helicase family protein [Muribaculaceae bacterium]
MDTNNQDLAAELKRLREENTWLKELLQAHCIPFEAPSRPDVKAPNPKETEPAIQLSLEEKVDLFRNTFQGREDVFARRWISPSTGKSGYQPVCLKEWNREFCDKKKYKCAECPNREFKELGYEDLYRHLEGREPNGRDVIGLYSIMPDHTCRFLCCDFDDKSCEHGFQKDVMAYVNVCREWNIPAYIERSRSGNGAHVWILFAEPVNAQIARQLGNAILTEAMDREGKITFKSYDRFFPNQDFMPEGGFGNLVALPLQGQARRKGNSVFVDDNFEPFADQWAYLQNMRKMSLADVDNAVNLHRNAEPLGELSKSKESAPWERPTPKPMNKSDFPKAILIVRSEGVYVPLEGLSAKVINHLKRLAAFKNPEFYAKLGMRLPTYNLPRVISCSELTDDYLIMPRGCEEAAVDFFASNNVDVYVEDKTNFGVKIDVAFNGILRPEQQEAVKAMTPYMCGILFASPGFGKTVIGAALIAEKKVNTLILVHTKALLDQWQKRLSDFLITDFKPPTEVKGRGRRKQFKQFGTLSSTENSLNGRIDVALLQSCMSDNDVKPFVREYGMVIVDECHHAPAVNFERVLKEVKAKYVYGLTATPIRKDGHQPIIFMQCGEIRYSSDAKYRQVQQDFSRILVPRFTSLRPLNSDGKDYNPAIGELLSSEYRNKLIIEDIAYNLAEGRTPLVLTARTSHVNILEEECLKICPNVIRLVGNDSAKAKREALATLVSIPNDAPLVVVATGKYVGEGFDLPRLDTLMLALPVSWKGLIAQYTGRLHRDFPGKKEVRIYDYVDLRFPICENMYRKRLQGYRSVGYSLGLPDEGLFGDPITEIFFDTGNFERQLLTDLSSAKRSIVISTYRLKWNHAPKIIELIQARLTRGVSITIVIAETGHRELEMAQMGINILHRPDCKMQTAIIDQMLSWYGNINFIGRPLAEANAIRLESPDFAMRLLESLEV